MIQKMLNRTSCRNYKKEKLSPEIIKSLIDVVNSSPTSSNAHHFGCVFLIDEELKSSLADDIYSYKMIKDASMIAIFYAENNRFDYIYKKTNTTLETDNINFLSTVVTDCAIAATMLQNAAMSFDLGTCFLGLIRAAPKKIMEKLNLGDNIPILGLVIGVKEKEEKVKPKFNKVFINNYDLKQSIKQLDKYDEVMFDYYKNRFVNSKATNYSETIIKSYSSYDDIFVEWSEMISKRFKVNNF